MDFGGSFSFGIDRVKSNPVFYIVGALILFFASIVVGGIASAIAQLCTLLVGMALAAAEADRDIIGLVIAIVPHLVGFLASTILSAGVMPMYVGFTKGIKKEYDGTGTAAIGDIFAGYGLFVPAALNLVLAQLAISIGSLLCLLPGIALLPLWNLSTYYLANGETKGIQALSKSFKMIIKAPMLILWSIVFGLVILLGVLACCVGVFATLPLAMAGLYMLCDQAVKAAGGDMLPPDLASNADGAASATAEPASQTAGVEVAKNW